MISRAFLGLTFLVFVNMSFVHTANETKEIKEKSSLSIIENVISDKIEDIVEYATERLAAFNDEHFGKTAVAKMINYEQIKPKLDIKFGRGKLLYIFIRFQF